MITFSKLGPERFASDEQYRKYLGALNTFVREKEQDADISHLLLCGSFLLGNLKESSDIDLFTVKKFVEEPFVTDTFVDGVRIEELVLTSGQMKQKLHDSSDSHLDLYRKSAAEAVVILGDNQLSGIINEAKSLL